MQVGFEIFNTLTIFISNNLMLQTLIWASQNVSSCNLSQNGNLSYSICLERRISY